MNSLQNDLDRIYDWTKKWLLRLNPPKCKHIRIHRSGANILETSYSIGGFPVPLVKEADYLGVTITSNLTWNNHIQKVSNNARGALGFLRRHLHMCTQEAKEIAYTTMVRPMMEYAASVWDPAATCSIHQLESVQRKAARFVTGTGGQRVVSVTAILRNLKWPTLSRRRRRQRLIIFHNAPALQHLSASLVENKDPTRAGRRVHFKLQHTKTQARLSSFLYSTVREWNALTDIQLKLSDINKFKRSLDCQTTPQAEVYW